jgi:hypothetical protein
MEFRGQFDGIEPGSPEMEALRQRFQSTLNGDTPGDAPLPTDVFNYASETLFRKAERMINKVVNHPLINNRAFVKVEHRVNSAVDPWLIQNPEMSVDDFRLLYRESVKVIESDPSPEEMEEEPTDGQ